MEKRRSWKDFAALTALFVALSGGVALWSGARPATQGESAPNEAAALSAQANASQPNASQPNASQPNASQPNASQAKAVPARIAWGSSYEKGLEQARQNGQPLMVYFYSDTCGYCRKLEAEVYPDKEVRAASTGLVTVKVNGDKRPDLAGAFGIYGYPFVAFLKVEKGKPGVKPIFSIPGFVEAPTFAQAMRDARAGKVGAQSRKAA